MSSEDRLTFRLPAQVGITAGVGAGGDEISANSFNLGWEAETRLLEERLKLTAGLRMGVLNQTLHSARGAIGRRSNSEGTLGSSVSGMWRWSSVHLGVVGESSFGLQGGGGLRSLFFGPAIDISKPADPHGTAARIAFGAELLWASSSVGFSEGPSYAPSFKIEHRF
ncbi:MAG: hypothetical protein HY542_07115 [Deltaproteobacteria bacterium]|nr:hypothetical protein [Deltaproteobacteria bacterium]